VSTAHHLLALVGVLLVGTEAARAEAPATVAGDLPATTSALERRPPRPRAPLVPRERTRVAVLTYHDIGTPIDRRTVDPRMFEVHMASLSANDVSVVRLSELIEFLEGTRLLPERAAVLMFDDGDSRMATSIVPLLERLGFPYTLSLPTSPVNFASRPDRNGAEGRIFDWQGVRRLVATGLCEAESHGHFHESLEPNNKYTRATELLRSRELIASNVGVPPRAFVFPMGYVYRGSNDDLAAAGYRAGLTTRQASVGFDTDRFQIPRIMIDGDVTKGLVTFLLRRVGVLAPEPAATLLEEVKRRRPGPTRDFARIARPGGTPHRVAR